MMTDSYIVHINISIYNDIQCTCPSQCVLIKIHPTRFCKSLPFGERLFSTVNPNLKIKKLIKQMKKNTWKKISNKICQFLPPRPLFLSNSLEIRNKKKTQNNSHGILPSHLAPQARLPRSKVPLQGPPTAVATSSADRGITQRLHETNCLERGWMLPEILGNFNTTWNNMSKSEAKIGICLFCEIFY